MTKLRLLTSVLDDLVKKKLKTFKNSNYSLGRLPAAKRKGFTRFKLDKALGRERTFSCKSTDCNN